MNISSGISEINLRRTDSTSPVYDKSYIWPKYHEGKIERVNGFNPQEQEPIYYKPNLVEREKLLSLMFNPEQEYNSSGKSVSRNHSIQPGSFFEALA
ncbi:MAG: hypothetical protein FWH53_02150 [Leptospirales bacterium]|nr:hypothetical protein [Leptospirales bacterium]